MMSEEKKIEETTEEKKTPEDAASPCDSGTCEDGTCKDCTCDDGSCKDDTCKDGTCGDGVSGTCCGYANKNIFIWLAIVVVVIGAIAYWQMQKRDTVGQERPVNDKVAQEVRDNALKLINEQLVPEGTKIEIGKVTEESGLYKMIITVEGQEVTSYMTKDMKKFIPQLIDVQPAEDATKGADDAAQAETKEVQAKSDKPTIELFVMSHCPYGTQIEKGILPVLKTLGTTVDAKIKFVDYAMHGEKEVKEQLRQYCIQEKEPQKYRAYLECFLDKQDEKACMQTAAINQTLLAQCTAQTDNAFKVTELFNDKSSWVSGQFPQFNIFKADNEKYGVQGSPTLVINGETVQSGRDSASLLSLICSAFNTQPAACQTEMSHDEPTPGFGSGTTTGSATSTDANCGA